MNYTTMRLPGTACPITDRRLLRLLRSLPLLGGDQHLMVSVRDSARQRYRVILLGSEADRVLVLGAIRQCEIPAVSTWWRTIVARFAQRMTRDAGFV